MLLKKGKLNTEVRCESFFRAIQNVKLLEIKRERAQWREKMKEFPFMKLRRDHFKAFRFMNEVVASLSKKATCSIVRY